MTKQQKKKFIEAARTVGAEDDEDVFDRMLGEIAKAPPPDTVQDRKAPKAKKPAK
ncbi:MAG: hypothetical protein JNM89_15690 [Hyphomicrobiaceae bacterium]|nr:hypothetical protein [Hyphomicrobiaceae bacterium]